MAAVLLYAAAGVLLNPILASAAMVFSSVSVVANSLRFVPCLWVGQGRYDVWVTHQSTFRLLEREYAEALQAIDVEGVAVKDYAAQHGITAMPASEWFGAAGTPIASDRVLRHVR